jgi:hypothetical protein
MGAHDLRQILYVVPFWLAVLGVVYPARAAQLPTAKDAVIVEIASIGAKAEASVEIESAEAGDADAQYNVGTAVTHENAHPALLSKGVEYLEKAAIQGHVLAMHNLAVLIRAGQVPKMNAADAFYWYQQAAEAGFAGSQNNLGDMYETGDGGTKSFADAIHWYTRAALQGEPTAYLSLGMCYAKGIGVSRNVVEAYRWLYLAVSKLEGSPNNRAQGERELADIAQTMSPTQIADGKRLAERFVPLKQTEFTIGDPRRGK